MLARLSIPARESAGHKMLANRLEAMVPAKKQVVGFGIEREALEILTSRSRVQDAARRPIFAKLRTAWSYPLSQA